MLKFSCSALNKIWDIPESGSALVRGTWSPEQGYCTQQTLVKWINGKIAAIEPLAPPSANYPVNSSIGYIPPEALDWERYFLMPGFLDAHVHLSLDSIDFYACLKSWSQPERVTRRVQTYLQEYLRKGIVGIRDGGDRPGFAWGAKQKVASGDWVGPKILSVREAVNRSGMYGRFLGRGFETIEQWSEAKDHFFMQGVDQLKIVVTGLIKFNTYGVVGPTQWSVEELKELVKNAHNRGIAVMAHASGDEGISVAIEAEVDSIEHGYYLTKDHLKKIQERGIAWVPTVSPIGNILKYDTERYSKEERSVLTRILNEHLSRIHTAYELNVQLGIGTDAGAYLVPHGSAFFDELDWFKEAGLPQKEILKSATQRNARIFGWKDFGSLTVGSPMNHLQLSDFIS